MSTVTNRNVLNVLRHVETYPDDGERSIEDILSNLKRIFLENPSHISEGQEIESFKSEGQESRKCESKEPKLSIRESQEQESMKSKSSSSYGLRKLFKSEGQEKSKSSKVESKEPKSSTRESQEPESLKSKSSSSYGIRKLFRSEGQEKSKSSKGESQDFVDGSEAAESASEFIPDQGKHNKVESDKSQSGCCGCTLL